MAKYKKPVNFERGYILAVSNLVALFDEPTMGASLLREEHLLVFDGRGFTEFDKNQFNKLNGESGVDIKI